MYISLSIPFYNYNDKYSLRYAITKKCFQHYSDIQLRLKEKGIFLHISFVGSEGEFSKELCAPFINNGMNEYSEYTQPVKFTSDGLRAKYNHCFAIAKHFWGDAFALHCIVGSNDFVFDNVFEQLVNCTESDLIGVAANGARNNLTVLDYLNRRAFLSDGIYPVTSNFRNELIGGFYALGRNLLGKLEWKPFQFPNDEVGMESHCKEKNYRITGIDSEIINVKTDSDLNGYSHCLEFKCNDISRKQLQSVLAYFDASIDKRHKHLNLYNMIYKCKKDCSILFNAFYKDNEYIFGFDCGRIVFFVDKLYSITIEELKENFTQVNF